jgi:hypothetical protein
MAAGARPTGPAQPTANQVATMRASNADRERTVDVLKAAYAEGRLTPEEYNDRIELVYRAQTYGQLSGIVHDLPSGPMPVPYLTPAPGIPAAFAPYPQTGYQLAAYPLPYPQPYPDLYGRPYAPPYPHMQLMPSPYTYGRPFDPYANPFAPPPRLRRTNGLAVASLVLALAQLPTLGLTALPALICGHIAKGQIRERGDDGEGMAVAGIVLGWLGVGLWVLFVFLSASSSGGHAGYPAPPAPAGP